MAKWTCKIMGILRNEKMEAVATDAPQLTAMAVATDSCLHFSEGIARMAQADVKNIAGIDQATLMVDQNYRIIA